MPPLGADRPFVAPTVQTAKLPNGLELFVVERRDLPKVNVTLVTRAGAVGDPAGKAGVANLTITAIDLGTKTRKALEIEQALGDLGTTLTGGAGRESARLSLDVLSRNLSPALAILADVVQNPTFPEDEIDPRAQARARRDRAGRPQRQRAVRRASSRCWRSGRTIRMAVPVQGLKGSVEGITRADLVAFHQARVKPGSTAIVLAGDISLAQATELVTKHFGAWSGRRRGRHHDSAGAAGRRAAASTWSTGPTRRRRSSRSGFPVPRARRPTTTCSTWWTRCGAAAASARG